MIAEKSMMYVQGVRIRAFTPESGGRWLWMNRPLRRSGNGTDYVVIA